MAINGSFVATRPRAALALAAIVLLTTALVGCSPKPEYHPEIDVLPNPFKFDIKEERLKVLKCGWESSDRLYYCDLENVMNYDLDDSYARFYGRDKESGRLVELDKRYVDTVSRKSVSHVSMGTLVYGDMVTARILIVPGRRCERDTFCGSYD